MRESIFKFFIKLFRSEVGKILIKGAIDQYVKKNDNDLTEDVADAIKKML